MATLYVAEFEEMPHTSGSKVPAALAPPLAEQTVAIAAGSAATTNPFNARTRFVRLHTDAICSVNFAIAPTATAAMMRLAAGATEYFGVPKGASYKVAVIVNT